MHTIAQAVQQCHICAPLLASSQREDGRALFQDVDGARFTGSAAACFVSTFSRALTAHLHVQCGDTLALAAHSGSVMFLAMLGALDAGAVVAPLNWRWSSSEIVQALQLTQPRLLLVDAACLPLVAQALSSTAAGHSIDTKLVYLGAGPGGGGCVPNPCVCSVWDLLAFPPAANGPSSSTPSPAAAAASELQAPSSSLGSTTSAAGSSSHVPMAQLQPPRSQPRPASAYELQLRSAPDGAAMMVFTSGTTGAAKGVVLSHSAFHAQSLVKLALVGTDPRDTYLHTAPLFHIGGLSSAFAALMAGASHVFLPKFSAADVLDAVQRCQVSSMIAVPVMLQDMVALAGQRARAQAQAPAACSSVTKLLVGAGSMDARLLVRTCSAALPWDCIDHERTAAHCTCMHRVWLAGSMHACMRAGARDPLRLARQP